ncbi:MAG: ferritin-like domain-containing protein [Actinomycetota bacterium]|nr:ferritin-like domain-containing protein [Actinomycetota bacterium]
MADDKQKLIQMLLEAHSNELALINTLEAHVNIAERGSYRSLLQDHISETRNHATRIQQRLQALGYRRSIAAFGYGIAQNALKQSLVLAKGPVDMLRGRGDAKEKMLRNARDEVMTEGIEIATYDGIESYARSIGDHETAELALSIRFDEERMFEALRKEIPVLAERVALTQPQVKATSDTEPWEGYDDMTVEEIEKRLEDASDSLIHSVRAYELKNKNRTTLIKATEKESLDA